MKRACLVLFTAGLWMLQPACSDDESVSGPDAGGDVIDDSVGDTPGCELPNIMCQGTCINPNTNSDHCGDCGNSCGTNEICVNGDCVPDCAIGEVLCGDACVDTNTNPNHCGRCGHACFPGQSCRGGECICPEGTEPCGSQCVDTDKDEDNCGECGHECEDDELCEDGTCIPDCPEDWIVCDGACVDPDTNREYCGDCNTSCGPNEVCSGGNCVCAAGLTECNEVCVDTDTNVQHCSDCNHPCPEGTRCEGGECVCTGDLTLCDDTCVDVQSHPDFCGDCVTACEEDEVCVEGDCITDCPEGQVVCEGVCTDLTSDSNHCGDCEHACRPDQECIESSCQCPEGLTECDGACVDTQTNSAHCSECNHPCDAEETCREGLCGCPEGLTECDGACVDIQSDDAHCGSCDEVCGPLEGCAEGDCVCLDGYTRCGEECVLLQTNHGHCGECFYACDADQVCSDGECADLCEGSLVSCEGDCVDIMTDEENCGECGWLCEGFESCVEGECTCVNDFYEYAYSDSLGGAAKFDPMSGWFLTPHFDDLRLCGEETDWYSLYVPSPNASLQLFIYGDCTEEILPILSLLDSEGVEIASDDGGIETCPYLIVSDLPQGWVYITVENVLGSGIYLLDYELSDLTEVEPNETYDESTGPFSGDFEVQAELTDWLDFDTYTIWVPRTTTLMLQTDDGAGSCQADTLVTVYDWWGEPLAQDDDGGVGLCSFVEVTVKRGYYDVLVTTWGPFLAGPYVLHADSSDYMEYEPNADVEDADGPFAQSFGLEGVIFPAYDVDRYEIFLEDTATIVAHVDGNEMGCMFDSRLELWSETALLGEDDDFDYRDELRNQRGYGYCSRIDPLAEGDWVPDQSWAQDLPAGTYYLVVAGYGDKVGAYNLNVDIVE